MKTIVQLEEEDVASGTVTAEQQAQEEVDGAGVGKLRARLQAIWQEQGKKAAKAEVERLYEAAGIDMYSNPVALKPLYYALRSAIASKARSPGLASTAAAAPDEGRDTAGARVVREHAAEKKAVLTTLVGLLGSSRLFPSYGDAAGRQEQAVQPTDVNPDRRHSGTVAQPPPTEPGPLDVCGPRLLPRYVQKIAVAKRAEILARHGKNQGDHGMVFKCMKSWARSHQHHLLLRLTGGFHVATREALQDAQARRAKYQELLSQGVPEGEASRASMADSSRREDPRKEWPKYLQRAGLDPAIPLTSYPRGSWICNQCWGLVLWTKGSARDPRICTNWLKGIGECNGELMTTFAGWVNGDPAESRRRGKKRSAVAQEGDRRRMRFRHENAVSNLKATVATQATWICERCGAENLMARFQCYRCSWAIKREDWEDVAGDGDWDPEGQEKDLRKVGRRRGKRGKRKHSV